MLEIRALTPEDDLRAVGEMYAQSWKYHYRGILPEDFLNRLTGDRWNAVLQADPASTIAAFENGSVVGAAAVGFPRDEGRESYGEIVSLYLLPCARGKGWGRGLLQSALESLAEEGCENVCLWVMEENRSAIGFYERMGFLPSGRKQTERYGTQDTALAEYIRPL